MSLDFIDKGLNLLQDVNLIPNLPPPPQCFSTHSPIHRCYHRYDPQTHTTVKVDLGDERDISLHGNAGMGALLPFSPQELPSPLELRSSVRPECAGSKGHWPSSGICAGTDLPDLVLLLALVVARAHQGLVEWGVSVEGEQLKLLASPLPHCSVQQGDVIRGLKRKQWSLQSAGQCSRWGSPAPGTHLALNHCHTHLVLFYFRLWILMYFLLQEKRFYFILYPISQPK